MVEAPTMMMHSSSYSTNALSSNSDSFSNSTFSNSNSTLLPVTMVASPTTYHH